MTVIPAYEINDLVILQFALVDTDGNPVDADTITCVVTDPLGGVTTIVPVHDSLGLYHVNVEPDKAGEWAYIFSATGDNQKSLNSSFTVRAPLT